MRTLSLTERTSYAEQKKELNISKMKNEKESTKKRTERRTMLVVSTPLKNLRQNRNLPQVAVNIPKKLKPPTRERRTI